MREVFLITYLAVQPGQVEPEWLKSAYESEFNTRASCEKVLEVLDKHKLYDTKDLHCFKVSMTKDW